MKPPTDTACRPFHESGGRIAHLERRQIDKTRLGWEADVHVRASLEGDFQLATAVQPLRAGLDIPVEDVHEPEIGVVLRFAGRSFQRHGDAVQRRLETVAVEIIAGRDPPAQQHGAGWRAFSLKGERRARRGGAGEQCEDRRGCGRKRTEGPEARKRENRQTNAACPKSPSHEIRCPFIDAAQRSYPHLKPALSWSLRMAPDVIAGMNRA